MRFRVIKANTVVYKVTKIVVACTTSTLVGSFALDTIIETGLHKVYDVDAPSMMNHMSVLHGKEEMDKNRQLYAYMKEDERKKQVTSGVRIKVNCGNPTILTIRNVLSLMRNVCVPHPLTISRPPLVTPLGTRGYLKETDLTRQSTAGLLISDEPTNN